MADTPQKPKFSLGKYITESQIYKSMFRHGYSTSDRDRALSVMTNVFFHLHPVKVRKSGAQSWKTLADSTQKGQALGATWAGETCYFKAGCYMFDPGPTEAPAAEAESAARAWHRPSGTSRCSPPGP